MNDIAGIIGAISGSISLLGLAYFLGVWRGKIDTALHGVQDSIKNYPPAEMWTMVKTLWDIYVVDALHHRPDLAEHGSGFKLKKEGEDLIPDHMKTLLSRIPHNPYNNSEAIATGYLVVKHIGLDPINDMAAQKELSVQETIAILSCWLEEHTNTNHPVA
ncbi:hypothetical protein LCGC14_1361560 [marine sediment metagenome]|uniref:Uncharacterized protein n=1 Tax=marine sediment metagenome TaxID=412755 RepID=A0A0F9KU27_9ZZZZ